MTLEPVPITHFTATSAVGPGVASLESAIRERRSGLRPNDFCAGLDGSWIGRVDGVESVSLPAGLESVDSRNNRLAWLGLQQDGFLDAVGELRARLGAERIGIVMGTSTSSIGQTELAYRELNEQGRMPAQFRQPPVHNPHSGGLFLASVTGLKGPCLTVSTACSSSAKVFAVGANWLRAGLVDACIVGGVDSLCLSVLFGFNSLELVASGPCRPFDPDRSGINIGEAAAFAILSRPTGQSDPKLSLRGFGESSDAHHMSHPHPEGHGAILAMDQALAMAGIEPGQVDYINLHGTASRANDLVETLALSKRFEPSTPASSTKGYSGHTLGAAGILETVITLVAMQTGLVPGTINSGRLDPECRFPVAMENRQADLRYAMTNSFGFGGSNSVLVLEHSK